MLKIKKLAGSTNFSKACFDYPNNFPFCFFVIDIIASTTPAAPRDIPNTAKL